MTLKSNRRLALLVNLNRRAALVTPLALCWLFAAPQHASADPALRVQMDVQGDFVLFGDRKSVV